MSESKKTHGVVNKPKISAQLLADYMVASERAKRSILQKCKYLAIARAMQHQEAKVAVSKYFREGGDPQDLLDKSDELRSRMADDVYFRDLFDINADYLKRFHLNISKLKLPDAEIRSAVPSDFIELGGTRVKPDFAFSLMRVTKSNENKIGAAVLRYSKGKSLSPETAYWHCAFVYGYFDAQISDESATPEKKLCIAIDGWSGEVYVAPGNTVTRFNNMKAACQTIAESWANIPKPKNAVL